MPQSEFLGGCPVFIICDVLAPGGLTLGDGEVGHEVVMGRPVPMLLAIGCRVDVAGMDLDHVLASRLSETNAVNDVKGLASFVRVPCSARCG